MEKPENSYKQFVLGEFKSVKKVVADLENRFPGKYSLQKMKKVDGYEMWILGEEAGDEIECGVFLVKDDRVSVIGDDAFSFIRKVLEKGI